MPFLTPNVPPVNEYICRRLRIPNQVDVIALVTGALRELTLYSNYEPFGDMPPEDVVQMFTEMFLDYVESDECMIGQISAFATVTGPDGWLECDGAIYENTDYPDLSAVLHPDLLVGLDSFRTPDLTGRFILGGSGDMGFYPAHEIGGAETVTLTEAEMPVHGHVDSGHQHPTHGHITTLAVEPGEVTVSTPWFLGDTSGPGFAAIQPAGGGDAHNNMPPFYTLRYFIRAR